MRVAKLDFFMDNNDDILKMSVYTRVNDLDKLENLGDEKHEKMR